MEIGHFEGQGDAVAFPIPIWILDSSGYTVLFVKILPMQKDPDNTDGIKWLNCVLRGDEAVCWVSTGQQWLVLSGIGSL